jgi:hypothetical protein
VIVQLNAATVALENLTEDTAALKADKDALEAEHSLVVAESFDAEQRHAEHTRALEARLDTALRAAGAAAHAT